jgi:ferrous iron transport protein B
MTGALSKPKVALVGTPNAGKTALFNLLTRSYQRVANYSGVTVDQVEADLTLPNGTQATLIDLPGAYSLKPYTEDEGVLLRALESGHFSAMILVVDATQPERATRFLIEVINEFQIPAVVAMNMSDLAQKQGYDFDFSSLSKSLGVPVVATAAVKKHGIADLLLALQGVMAAEAPTRKKHALLKPLQGASNRQTVAQNIIEFYKLADTFQKQFVRKKGGHDRFTRQLDHWVLHPVLGAFILLGVLAIAFQLMFNLAALPMDWIDQAFGFLGKAIQGQSAWPDWLKSLLADGIVAGVGGTLVFLPQILILFALILVLEDFGFMARAVFLLDHWMGKVGLPGRAFLPLLSSYACAVPGIMSVKAIESPRDRIITIMMIPLTTCSARIPVYTLLISAFIPNTPVFIGFRLQGLVMLGLYAAGIVSALMVGALLRLFFLRGPRTPLLIELPSYKWPSLRSLVKGIGYRGQMFLRRVGTIILGLTIVIWFMVTFPAPGDGSAAALLGQMLEPILRPLGFDWRIGMALVPTFAAREVMVAALSTAYAVSEGASVSDTNGLSQVLQQNWSVATGLSLMVFFIFAPMCISTLAAAKRELQSPRWFGVMVIYLFGMAYAASALVYYLAS